MVLLECRFTLSVVTSCYFMSLYLYISSFQFFLFVFFFVCAFLFSPIKTREASWSLVGLCLFPSCSELQQPPLAVSLTHVFFRRCYQKCVSALRGDPWSGRGAGGWGGSLPHRCSDQRLTPTCERKPAVGSSGLVPTWIFKKKSDAMRVLTLPSRPGSVCVCVGECPHRYYYD